MGANAHTEAFRSLDGAAHGAGVAGVKAGGDIGGADQRHEFVIDPIADGPWAEALTHVRIEIHCLHVNGSLSL